MKTETFYAAISGHDNKDFEELNARTLRGAKCEATRLYGAGFCGDRILIAIPMEDYPWMGLEIIAIKVLGEDRKWSTFRNL